MKALPLRRRLVLFCAIVLSLPVSLLMLTLGLVVAGFDGSGMLPADCAIVFGATVHAVKDPEGTIVDSRAGPGIVRRMETAIALYRSGLIDRLIVTGGKGEDMIYSEAEVMEKVALERGVQPSDIVTEDRAESTRENLLLARPLTSGCTSVVGISDRYHLARIEFLAKQMDWNLETIPAEKHPNFLFEARSVLREALGILYYGFSGFLS